MTPEQYVRSAIQRFIADPADSDYQEGYFDALLTVAKEAFGLYERDVLKRDPPRQVLTVIDGGHR